MPPTIPPSTTLGMRIRQTMFHSASLTPESIEIHGRRSSSSSGTRHHVGPAGPTDAPIKTANTSTAALAPYQAALPALTAGVALAGS